MASCGTLQVVSDFVTSAVKADCPSDLPGTLNPGDRATVNVPLDNRNSASADATIEVHIGGSVAGKRTVTISGESRRSYGVEIVAPSDYGEFSISTYATSVSQA